MASGTSVVAIAALTASCCFFFFFFANKSSAFILNPRASGVVAASGSRLSWRSRDVSWQISSQSSKCRQPSNFCALFGHRVTTIFPRDVVSARQRAVHRHGGKLSPGGGLLMLFCCYNFAQSSSRSAATTPSLLPHSTVAGARSTTLNLWE